jgi:hypothetical protein
MPSFIALLPFCFAACSAVAFPQPQPTNAAAIAAGNVAASQASAAAASAAAQFTSNAAASASAASDAALYSASAGSSVLGAAAPQITGPDACGPKIPDPRVPDSCDSYVDVSTGPAMPYNASCLNDGSGAVLNTNSCEELIQVMCSNEFQHAGEWVWASNDGCSLGSYLPLQNKADGTPTGAAKWPEQANCEVLIYGSMLSVCTGSGSNKYNTIAVNLPVIPNNTPKGTGQQVNAGYGSYLITPYQPRNQTDGTGEIVPNNIPAASIISAASANLVQVIASDSAILATMTGSGVAAAKSDLAAYAAAQFGP